jgi:integrase
VRIPGDLVQRFGRRELKVSLRTTDGRKARAEGARVRARAYDFFERLRQDPMLTDDEIIQLARGFYIEKTAEASDWRGLADHEPRLREVHEAQIAGRAALEDEIRRDLRAGRPDLVWTEAEVLMHDLGRPEEIDENSAQFRKLCHFMLRGLLEATRRAREEDDCVFGGEPMDPVFKDLDSIKVPQPSPAPPPSDPPAVALVIPAAQALRLGDVLDLWKAENRPRDRTISDFTTQIRRFIEINGDVPVADITTEHVRLFKNEMLKFPAVVKASDRHRTVAELVAMATTNGAARLSPRTVKDKALGALSAILGYAAGNGLRDGNPASRMPVGGTNKTKTEEPLRLPYTTEDLKLIFGSPVFTEGKRPRGGAGETAKWLPLLALFSGARLEELGRLRVSDVGVEDGIRFLFIHGQAGGKGVKTAKSRRKVPVHPDLERLGFLDYADQRRTTGPNAPLFPDLKSERDEITAAFSQWWGRYIDDLGIEDSRKVFHSFRHTVKRVLRNAGVEKTLRDALMGHAHEDVAEEYGLDEEGWGISLPVLAEALRRLDYPAELRALLDAIH